MVDVSALMARLTGDRQEGLDEHGIRLVVDVEPSLKVWGIEAQVQTVLSNLVSNARDAIVSAERETPGVIEVQAGLEGPECVIRVHDDGVGIPERDLGQIFDAFFSTRPAAGSGLGLAVVKEIVEANGGRVAVKSKEGVGSEFTVVLPAVNR